MKSSILAVAAAMATSAGAVHLKQHRHELAHDEMRMRAIMGTASSGSLPTGIPSCGCATVYETVTGQWSWIPNPPAATNTTTIVAVSSVVPSVATTSAFSTTCINETSSSVYVAPSTSSVYVAPTTSSTSSVYVAPTTSSVYIAPTTSSVYVAPTTSSVYVAPTTSSVYVAPTTSSVYVAPTTSSVYVAPTTSSSSSTSVFYTVPSSSEVSSFSTIVASSSSSAVLSSTSSASSSTSSSSGSIGASGCKGITYTPYSSDGSCLNYAQVLIDLTLIKTKGFNAIRTYSTDCDTLSNVGGVAELLGLKIILGIYIDSTGVTGSAASQVSAITEWAKWSIVDMFVIGNEAVFNGYCTASELVSFIQSTKETFNAAGFSGTYTTAEPLNIVYELVDTDGFCDSIDFVGGNYHPFFNAQIEASGAGAFVAAQLKIADGLCSGKTGINLETGWPSSGSCNGAACPSSANQKIAVDSIVQYAGSASVMFSFQNDLWKSVGEFACEQSWGLISLFL